MSETTRDALLARARRVEQELHARELDALLVESASNLRYLTGFTGSRGVALMRAGNGGEDVPERGHEHLFMTDFRYSTQSEQQLGEHFLREISSGELIEAIAAALAGAGGRLGFDDASMTVAAHRRLGELLGADWELVPSGGILERLRLVKDAGELMRIRGAAALADEALSGVLERGLVGRSEHEVAVELELAMRRLGADSPSFPSIVAAGARGALPHAEPTTSVIPRDVLVTIDWGALHEGYCSDCTRTYATGEGVSAQACEVYALVLEAQEQGLAAARAGRSGREVDAVARAVIEEAGHGQHFGHGLGHGVGLEVHEGPRLSRTAGEDPLLVGSVVTVEPGVYLPGELGVRIEDLVVLTDEGQEVLTSLPKELTVVS